MLDKCWLAKWKKSASKHGQPGFSWRHFFFFLILFIYGCVGSSFLCEGFLWLWQVGATHYRGLSRCGAQAPDAQAQQLWLTGLVAPRHVGSSQTRARTRVPCIGRQIPNHCATREALLKTLLLLAWLPLAGQALERRQWVTPQVCSCLSPSSLSAKGEWKSVFIKYILFLKHFSLCPWNLQAPLWARPQAVISRVFG